MKGLMPFCSRFILKEFTMSDEMPSATDGSGDRERQPVAVKENLKKRSTWLRLFFMLVMVVLYSVSRVVVSVVVLLQFFWVLFTAETNKPLEKFGQSLATYTYQIIRYLTFNTEERPFPFDLDWPTGPLGR
jgi:Flp pilus assembly protein TadB